METNTVTIQSIDNITHDVIKIVTGKPVGYTFEPGQATEISINIDGWEQQKKPFTFTSLPSDDHLEFTIKTYPDHKGFTNALLQLKQYDELILHEVFGAIAYKGEGVFIAGGAGITPFICIFRHLHANKKIKKNKLLFANKAKKDIILEKEFTDMLGDAFINILSDEDTEGYEHGMINENFLKANITDFTQQFYVCGPPPMMEAILKQLTNLGVTENLITKEGV